MSFVSLGFVFRNSHSNQRPRKTTKSAAYPDASESCHYGTCGDDGTNARKRHRAHSNEPAERSTNCGTRSNANRRSFWRFRSVIGYQLLVGIVLQ
jgi:hypothetical protein